MASPSEPTDPPGGARRRVIDATSRCTMKYSLQRTTIDDISRESGVSRATIYRLFPGGRDDVISSTVAHEVGEFLLALADDVRTSQGLEDVLVDGLMAARRRLRDHELFQRVMAVEPEIVLPWLTTESDRIVSLISGFLEPYLASEGVEHVQARGEYLARLFLSYVETPGSWNLEDRSEVRALVTREFVSP